MPSKKLLKRLRDIAKEFKVSVRYERNQGWYGGYYHGDKKHITVVRTRKLEWFISAFFHELSHVLDHRDGLYKGFYGKRAKLPRIRFLALRAERHTDNRAAKACKKYFPKVEYKYGYRLAWQVEWLRGYYADNEESDE